MAGSLNRREFLMVGGGTAAGLAIGFRLGSGGLWGGPGDSSAVLFAPNAWLRVAPDGVVTITVARSDMGQGVRTTLPMIVAEELDADWSTVRVEQAGYDPRYGSQLTEGSTSVREGWEPLRRAGAAAREMLLTAAAGGWGVSPSECATASSKVIHSPTGRRLGYGELAAAAARLPVPKSPTVKDARAYTLVGSAAPGVDTVDRVHGRAVFGSDVRVPGMVFATIVRCPTFGGSAAQVDAAAARVVPGVVDVVSVSTGVAVVGRNTWAALQGRAALEVSWDRGPWTEVSSESIFAMFAKKASLAGATMEARGDAAAAMAAADGRDELVYRFPFLAHATMEPQVCTADVRSDGCDVWAPTQNPKGTFKVAREVSGHGAADVRVHVTLMGGGFGRRSEKDFVVEALELSKELGRPVQVMWTREDDLQHDFYRPAALHRVRVGWDDDRVTAWEHHVVAPSVLAQRWPDAFPEGKDQTPVYGATDLPYGIPNVRVSHVLANTHVPTWWWRAVAHSRTAYANEHSLDHAARKSGRDPLALRRQLLAEAPRLLGALDLATELAGWGQPLAEGRALGVACHTSFGAHVAMVAEVSITDDKDVRVHRVVAAVDCGRVINRDLAAAQVEGGIVFGLSAALKDEITIEAGAVVQSNFGDYDLLRMAEAPRIEVHFVPSDAPPGGLGEAGVPPAAPAVANGVLALTSQPVTRLPIRLPS